MAAGKAERAYRKWVRTLGPLSPRQTADAERLYALARQLDIPGERPASAFGTISRAITQVANQLRDEKNGAGKATPATPEPEPEKPPEPVDPVDEIARRRAQRHGGVA